VNLSEPSQELGIHLQMKCRALKVSNTKMLLLVQFQLITMKKTVCVCVCVCVLPFAILV